MSLSRLDHYVLAIASREGFAKSSESYVIQKAMKLMGEVDSNTKQTPRDTLSPHDVRIAVDLLAGVPLHILPNRQAVIDALREAQHGS